MKLEKLRAANAEEIEKIKSESDLTPTSKVLQYGNITAVWRVTNELDPVFYNETPTPQRYLFLQAVLHFLMGTGSNEFYFNVPASDATYQNILEKLGAERTSKEPEFRYKITL